MYLKYINFLRKLLIYTIILAVTGYVIVYFLPDKYISKKLPYLYLFFMSITGVVHYILLRISLKRETSFANYFMLLTFGKLIFFLSIILIYALINREDAPQFIISFFILYVFYTAFEVVLSLSQTKSRKENPE